MACWSPSLAGRPMSATARMAPRMALTCAGEALGTSGGTAWDAAVMTHDLPKWQAQDYQIVAELAKATLEERSTVDWDHWVADYSRIREQMAHTFPETFHDINKHMWAPGGVHRPLPARVRTWNTENKKANFLTPKDFFEQHEAVSGENEFDLITLRSND